MFKTLRQRSVPNTDANRFALLVNEVQHCICSQTTASECKTYNLQTRPAPLFKRVFLTVKEHTAKRMAFVHMIYSSIGSCLC